MKPLLVLTYHKWNTKGLWRRPWSRSIADTVDDIPRGQDWISTLDRVFNAGSGVVKPAGSVLEKEVGRGARGGCRIGLVRVHFINRSINRHSKYELRIILSVYVQWDTTSNIDPSIILAFNFLFYPHQFFWLPPVYSLYPIVRLYAIFSLSETWSCFQLPELVLLWYRGFFLSKISSRLQVRTSPKISSGSGPSANCLSNALWRFAFCAHSGIVFFGLCLSYSSSESDSESLSSRSDMSYVCMGDKSGLGFFVFVGCDKVGLLAWWLKWSKMAA